MSTLVFALAALVPGLFAQTASSPCVPSAGAPAAGTQAAQLVSQVPGASTGRLQLAPGLTHFDFSCTANGHRLHFYEVQHEAGNPIELRALPNPGAHPDDHCVNGYGGTGMPDVASGLAGFEPLAATNGNFFGQSRGHWRSDGMIWSRGSGQIAPPTATSQGGSNLFIADAEGAHVVTITESLVHGQRVFHVRAGTRTSAAQAALLAGPIPEADLTPRLSAAFPTMTLAMQLSIPLVRGGHALEGSRCPGPGSNSWYCQVPQRTVLCGRADGSISLLTISSAMPYDIAVGLHQGGPCHSDCTILFNLDGGGSTQMVYRDPASQALTLDAVGRIAHPHPGCPSYRPVDDYLMFGAPQP